MAIISSCSHWYPAREYHKPIVCNTLSPSDSILPLKYFRQDRAMLLDTNIQSIQQTLFAVSKKDSLYPFTLFKGADSCEVHHHNLQVDTVSIVYGLIADIEIKVGSLEAQRKIFPNANFSVWGGCNGGYPKFAEVLFCPVCRINYRDWYDDYVGYYH